MALVILYVLFCDCLSNNICWHAWQNKHISKADYLYFVTFQGLLLDVIINSYIVFDSNHADDNDC